MIKAVLVVGLGGAIGSILRWVLSISFNALFPTIPLGTLAANLIAAYIIGLCMAVFAVSSTIAPEWRLFIMTGCLGGLSTFSTFSMEVTSLLQQQRFGWALTAIATHVLGSIGVTLLGILTVYLFGLLIKS